MKTRQIGTKKPPAPAGAEAVLLSLQEELVVAIHGAFEVAVEIAVREVSKLVGQATGGIYEEMRRENESLKQILQEAEAMLDSKQLLDATMNQPPLSEYNHKSPVPKASNEHGCTGVRGDTAGHSRAEQPPQPQHEHVSRDQEQKSDHDWRTVSDASDPERANGCAVDHNDVIIEAGGKFPHVCVVRLENTDPTSQDPDIQNCDSPQLPHEDDRSTLGQVTVKQEKPEEEESDGSSCFLDSIKEEDFSPECMSAVQSKMLEEWKPEVLDIQSQDSNTALSCTRPTQAHPSYLTTNLAPPTDLPSLSSEFPDIFQTTEPAPIPEAPPQVYGVHVRTRGTAGHTFSNLYACKCCGQTFHLPSLLRRHYGQCLQKLQQSCQLPVGGKRAKLQLYPPGCSPFRCTECNREFNRMENLKTHLRIHTGERPYTCSVCSKCFRHSGALTRHFRIHTGEKPYICGQCGKSFRNCGGLKFHQRLHSKQLQQQC